MVTARGRSCCQGSEATLTRVSLKSSTLMFFGHRTKIIITRMFFATPFNDYLLTVIKRCMRSKILGGRYNASHGN